MHHGKILKDILIQKGLPLKDFADKLGVSRQSLYLYFGKEKFDDEFVKSLSKAVPNAKELFKPSELALAEPGNGIRKRGRPYLSDIDAFAGKVDIVTEDIQEYITGYIYIPEFSKADLYINVRGHSMYPKYAAGEIISLKRVNDMTEIQFGQVYVVVTEENRVIKYVRKGKDHNHFKLVSENPKFDDYEVDRKKVKAMFLVLGKISKDVL